MQLTSSQRETEKPRPNTLNSADNLWNPPLLAGKLPWFFSKSALRAFFSFANLEILPCQQLAKAGLEISFTFFRGQRSRV